MKSNPPIHLPSGVDMQSLIDKTDRVEMLLNKVLTETLPSELNLDQVRIDPTWSARVPAPFAIRRKILPLCSMNGVVQIAVARTIGPASDSAQDQALDATSTRALSGYLGCPFVTVVAEPTSLKRAIARVYGTLAAHASAEKQTLAARDHPEEPSNANISLVDQMIQTAVQQNASDIHLTPSERTLKIQFRIDGVLETYRDIPIESQNGLVNRLKVLAELDIAEKRSPQDGSFSVNIASNSDKKDKRLDVRLATLPTRFGERLTMRLLGGMGASGQPFGITNLGMRQNDQRVFESALAKPHGLVLLTGPTGSGKSTTLYAAISELMNKQRGNIITVEDPIEYEVPGISQVQVDGTDRLSFSKALRSLLRHDPDVIMIGEIRDAESASVAVKASLTGHLVLSTLHTNTAVGVVNRLVDMGVERFLIAATLRLSMAQRLVRKLCRHCGDRRPLTSLESNSLRCPEFQGSLVSDAAGCVYCAGRGYAGRVALFEMMECTETVSSQIGSGIAEQELWSTAYAGNQSSLIDDGIAKLLSGQTTVSELLSAICDWNPS